VTRCAVCGSAELHYVEELSAALIGEWELSVEEAAYVNRQQGLQCVQCGSTLRCMALATALLRHCGGTGTFAEFSASPAAQQLRLLEINEAGGVAPFLAQWPGHQLVRYPDVDMQHLPQTDSTFDLVVHSDTLEHVPDPVAGLAECRRVLRDSGACVYTVPIIVGRLTRSRAGLPPSYHGDPCEGRWLPGAHRVWCRCMALAAGRRIRRLQDREPRTSSGASADRRPLEALRAAAVPLGVPQSVCALPHRPRRMRALASMRTEVGRTRT
jgi:SAM-dependent methyltransferase